MRRLRPDEIDAWRRLMATTRPLRPVPVPAKPPIRMPEPIVMATPLAPVARVKGRVPPLRVPPQPPVAAKAPINTLDGSWDRKLVRGAIMPDSSLDLHGHTLASAHAMLDAGLDRSIRRGDRVLLLVTGKPPRPESERPHARGAIRAAVADWLAASRHADAIAAVRGAHPRHGGTGALYIILRRPRER